MWRCCGRHERCEPDRAAFTLRQDLPGSMAPRTTEGPDMILNNAILTYAGFAVAHYVAFSMGLV